MVAFNKEALCKEAEAHYLDFLPEGNPDIVPRHIIDHVRGCQDCRSRIEQLGNILAHRFNTEILQTDEAIRNILKLHFAYLGRQVSCKTVRPFLPALIDSSLEIRIPTPITAHLDNCKSCSDDLETIRKLNLSRGQLCRLSQMYADKPKDKYIACPKSQAVINPVVNLSLHETNANILKHLCLCPFCRKLVFEARKFNIKLLAKSAEANTSQVCSQLSPCDIFDYAITYGIDPKSDQYVKFRESLTAHIRKCPKCMSRIQDLHQTLFGIIDRPESGVVTVCHTIESQEAQMPLPKHSENLYSGFPVRVEVSSPQRADIKKQPVSTNAGTRIFSARRLTPLAKLGAVAAVLAIIVSLFIFTTTSAKAVTLDKIYEAVLKVKNVHISIFAPDKAEPSQERWISREKGMYATKTGNELALWDFNRAIEKHYNTLTDTTKTIHLEDNALVSAEEKIGGSLGLMPFEDISKLPKDAQWHQVVDKRTIEDASFLEVYDLLWAEKSYSGPTTKNKWRVYVNPKTNLPQRTEFYQMTPDERKYVLISFKIIEYPTDNEMQSMVEKLTF